MKDEPKAQSSGATDLLSPEEAKNLATRLTSQLVEINNPLCPQCGAIPRGIVLSGPCNSGWECPNGHRWQRPYIDIFLS